MFNFSKKFEKKKEEPIHPDFKIKDGIWWWNFTDFSTYIKRNRDDLKSYNVNGIIKIAFPFNNPELLDSCPFMCKIGENLSSNKDAKWFGVAYAYKDETEKLKEFGQKFPRYELISDLDDMGN